jgi:hypothetical protein
MPPDRGGFTWDARTARYRRGGRFVSRLQIRMWLDEALDASGARIAALAEQLRAARIDLVSWQVRMAREIKNVQLYSAAAAKGGWAQLTQADLGRVGQSVQAQLRYLNRFARQIQTGAQPLDGRMVERAKMYADSGRQLFDRTYRAEMIVRGYTHERSVRYAGDSCAGCVAEAAKGWVSIGSIVPVGQRQCLSRCRCTVSYRRELE